MPKKEQKEYINFYTAIEALRYESRPQEHFYFSDLGKCFRQRILRRLNIPQYPMDNRGLRIINMGKLVEKFFLNVLRKAKVLKATNEKIWFGEFSGRTDAKVIAFGDERRIEIKSINSKAFHYMKDNERPPHIHYLYQAIGYGKLKGDRFVHLDYVSRDDLCYREYILCVDKYRQEVTKDMLKLKHYWRTKTFPSAIPYNEAMCAYCPFFKSKNAKKNLKECKELHTVQDFQEKMKKELKS